MGSHFIKSTNSRPFLIDHCVTRPSVEIDTKTLQHPNAAYSGAAQYPNGAHVAASDADLALLAPLVDPRHLPDGVKMLARIVPRLEHRLI